MLALYLAGCLINHDLYEQRRAELTDADADGHAQAEDCDDADPAVFPGATEVCNGVDDDCDQLTDEEAADASPWYRDADLDGYGNPADLVLACQQPQGYTQDDTDCDDLHDQVHPGAEEIPYDDFDNDCQGGDLTDVDGDTHAATQVGGDDCDDLDPEVYPGAAETWGNGATDNDCDGDYGAALLDYGADAWTGESEGDNAGRRLAALGDVTGDGLAEFAVGAIYQDRDYEYGGAIYIVSGGEPGPLAEEGVLRPSGANWFLGGAMDGGQDVDGDGVPDLLTGSSAMDEGRGAAWLVSGRDLPGEGESVLLESVVSWEVVGQQADGYLGAAVGFVGDVDGDGISDCATSASYQDVDDWNEAGRMGIWTAVASGGTMADADIIIDGHYDQARLGANIEAAGDQDGDGYDDFLVGFGQGVVASVLPGGTTGFIHPVDDAITVLYKDDDSGIAFARVVGDIDGDGHADLAMVLDNYDLYFFSGLSVGPTRSPKTARSSVKLDGDSYVFDVAGVGDLDGDGTDETLIPAKWYAPVGAATATIAFGADLDPGTSHNFSDLSLRAVSARSSADYGYRVRVSADVDGDGRPDVVMAGSGDDVVGTDAGAVTLLPLPL